MYVVTAYLTIKNKTFYTVLTYYVDGIRKMKWVSTGFKENESKKKAEKKETPNYADMTVSELRKIAKDKGVAGYSTMKKDELISSLN